MNPKLSIAAICYNNEDYIKELTDSILQQNFPFGVEVVITDDRSTDNSWDKLLVAKKRLTDAGIQCSLYRSEINGGVGPTRHNSLMRCTGEWVAFLDGDDFLAGKNSLRMAVAAGDSCQADCVMVGSTGSSANWACGSVVKEPVFYDGRAACMSVLNGNNSVVVWNKIWRRKAISNVDYPRLRSNEDTVATPIWLWHCAKVVQVPFLTYVYRSNPQSLTHNYCPGKDPVKRKAHLECMAIARAYLRDFFAERDPIMNDIIKW